jgi:hypothetical protein
MAGKSPAIELEVLLDLEQHEIARELIRRLRAGGERPRHIVGDPRAQHLDVELLPARGVRGGALGGGQVPCSMHRRLRRLEQHPEEARVHIGDAAVPCLVRGAHDPLRARLVSEKSADEIIHRLQGAGGCGAQALPRQSRGMDR